MGISPQLLFSFRSCCGVSLVCLLVFRALWAGEGERTYLMLKVGGCEKS